MSFANDFLTDINPRTRKQPTGSGNGVLPQLYFLGRSERSREAAAVESCARPKTDSVRTVARKTGAQAEPAAPGRRLPAQPCDHRVTMCSEVGDKPTSRIRPQSFASRATVLGSPRGAKQPHRSPVPRWDPPGGRFRPPGPWNAGQLAHSGARARHPDATGPTEHLQVQPAARDAERTATRRTPRVHRRAAEHYRFGAHGARSEQCRDCLPRWGARPSKTHRPASGQPGHACASADERSDSPR